ncbi:MAG: ATP-binding protein [Bacteroidales bacterium]|nr:ATP-binding protein [Bacteroidales bacterium]
MNNYIDYCNLKNININTKSLEIVKKDDFYIIYNNGVQFLTPKGYPYKHKLERVIAMVCTEMMRQSSTTNHHFSFQTLFGFQRDCVESSNDFFINKWKKIIDNDPFVRLKIYGKSGITPFPPDHELFNFSFIIISMLVRSINELINKTIRDYIVADSDSHPFLELLCRVYHELTPEQKAVVQAISEVHRSGIVLPLTVVTGLISPTEYVNGILALQIQEEKYSTILFSEINQCMDYLACFAHSNALLKPLSLVIAEGESEILEFKSTLRWDIRAGKTNQAVERVSLKTIAAFLNSRGGTLLIGIRDDGSIEGIETDKFVNEDKFLLHLWTLIRTCLGREVSPFISTSLEKIGEKTICMVTCVKNNRPVFLRQPGFPEEFYIRVGPASNAMDISEALKYISDWFPLGKDTTNAENKNLD